MEYTHKIYFNHYTDKKKSHEMTSDGKINQECST